MPADPLSVLPEIGSQRLAIRVRPQVERVLRDGHPWLFEGSITRMNRAGMPGDIAVIFDSQNRFLAAGLYDPTSPIRVRLLVHGKPQKIGRDLYVRRLQEAAKIREPLQGRQTTGYRLVHGANDGLAGLVIDRYASSYVVKLDTVAWIPHLRLVLGILQEEWRPQRIVLRLSRHLLHNEALLFGLSDGQILLGDAPQGPVLFLENGLQFEADLLLGQKTGFFLDQRENRRRAQMLAHGRIVLNVFAHSGAFSVYTARGGAPEIHSLDQSGPALDAARRHFSLNRSVPGVAAATHATLQGDAFQRLVELAQRDERYGMVILDPPSFARRKREVPGALKAYARLLQSGLAVLDEGGIIVSSSCSSRVTAQQFYETVSEAARATGRPLQEIERTGHPLDHPIGFPEGAYLKTLFATAP